MLKIEPLKDNEKDLIERDFDEFPFKFKDSAKSINPDFDIIDLTSFMKSILIIFDFNQVIEDHSQAKILAESPLPFWGSTPRWPPSLLGI